MKKYEAFIADTNKDYAHEDIVVSIVDDPPYLKKGQKFILLYYNFNRIYVKDLSNNMTISSNKDNFISELEYETGSEVKKYNL